MQIPVIPTSRFTARPRPERRSTPRRLLPLPATMAFALVLALAGCGGSSSPGVAHVANTSDSGAPSGSSPGGGSAQSPESTPDLQQQQKQLVKYAQCMRTHGEPEFPEPVEGRIALSRSSTSGSGSGMNPESPQFQAAEKACKQYQPVGHAPSPQQQAKLEEQALKMSECMRRHGVPNFPDPTFSSSGGGMRVTLKAGKSTGIEPNSPQFQAAQKACQGNSPLGKGLRAAPIHTGGPGGGSQSSESVGVAP